MAERRDQVRKAATGLLLSRHAGADVLRGATLTPEGTPPASAAPAGRRRRRARP
jgi:hypothetical protein